MEKLIIADKALVFQNEENQKLVAALIIANKELVFENEEKEKRAAELIVYELEIRQVFQNLITKQDNLGISLKAGVNQVQPTWTLVQRDTLNAPGYV